VIEASKTGLNVQRTERTGSHASKGPVWALLAAAVTSLAWTAPAHANDCAMLSPSAVPTSLPLVAEHRYRMAGKIRPLLFFWIGRDDVGEAHIVWRRGDGRSAGFELLIGSDPRRAPRGINRWGYVREEVRAGHGRTIGVMTQSDEASIEEAEARIALEGQGGVHVFKAIQAAATTDEACAFVTTVHVGRDLTYRDVATLLNALARPLDDAAALRRIAVPPGTQPGFLVALAELIQRSVDAHRRPASAPRSPPDSLGYVYNAKLHDLTLRQAEFVPEVRLGDRTYAAVIRGEFESRDRTSGSKTRFEILYGTEGALKAVPVHIVYHPRWWLRVELFLEERAAFWAATRFGAAMPVRSHS